MVTRIEKQLKKLDNQIINLRKEIHLAEVEYKQAFHELKPNAEEYFDTYKQLTKMQVELIHFQSELTGILSESYYNRSKKHEVVAQ